MTRRSPDSAAADGSFGLTPLQEGMLYDHLTAADPGLDVEQIVGEFAEPLDVGQYEAAWNLAVASHDVLRSRFYVLDEGRPRQEVVPHVEHPFSFEDLRDHSDEAAESRIADFLAADRARGFVLERAPASRVHVFLRNGDRYVLVWTFHHIILDGRSHARVLRDVYEAYNELRVGRSPEIAASGSVRQHVERIEELDYHRAEPYWRERLQSIESPTQLPQIGVGADLNTRPKGHEEVSLVLTEDQFGRLQAAIASSSAQWGSVVQAAWGLVLSRYVNERCVAFGSIRASLPPAQAGEESPLGMFINNVPAIVMVDETESLSELARKIQMDQFVEARDFEHIPLSAVQSWSSLAHGTSLFDTILVYDHRDLNGALRAIGPEWTNRDLRLLEQTRYPATLLVFREPTLRATLRYDRRSIDPEIASQILGHLEQVLDQFAQLPDRPLGDFALLGEKERHHVVHGFNDTKIDYPSDETLDSMFRDQVERSPGAVALISDDDSWTYQELSERATAVAATLTERGVQRDTVVGVMVDRSCEMMAAILGVIRAGCAYLPLNPEDPVQRLDYMLETASAEIVIAERSLLNKLENPSRSVIQIEDAIDYPTAAVLEFRSPQPDDLAYVIFTSGSTGRPKGVMIEHRSICNRLRWMQDTFELTAEDRVFQKTPLTFDVSVWEVFWAIIEGASIVLAAPGRHRDSRYMRDTIHARGVTVMHFVPSMLRLFLGEDGLEEACGSLRCVVCSGEELTRSDVARFNSRLNAPLHNLYGPTEAAVDVSHWSCDAPAMSNTVPIGRSIANTRLYVLDPHGRACPVGVPGELFIAGVQVGRGYIGRSDLTEERFVPDEVSGLNGRMYRTGDRARWLPDGSMEFLGRNDFEIKLSGVRIDLAEIEAALREIPGVDDAVVVAGDAPGGQKRLIAYYTTSSRIAARELRSGLRRILPATMVPSVFMKLDSIPLSTAGKVARAQLPEPVESDSEVAVAPQSGLEARIGAIWAEALGRSHVSVGDNFFDLGGQSMMLLMVHRKIEEELGVEFPVTKSLEHTTVLSLAAYLEDTTATNPRIARARARGARTRTRNRRPTEL